jgi:hypothetical protein
MIAELSNLFDVNGQIGTNAIPNVILILEDVPAVLDLFQSHFQAGGIVPIEGTRTFVQWHVQKYDQVERILSSMLPHLRRQERAALYALELTKLIRREFDQEKSEADLLIRRRLADMIRVANEDPNG